MIGRSEGMGSWKRRSRASVLSGSHLIEVKGIRSFAEVVIDIEC